MTKSEAKPRSGEGWAEKRDWDCSHAAVVPDNLVQNNENSLLLDALNAAYDDSPDLEEQVVLLLMRRKQRELVGGQR